MKTQLKALVAAAGLTFAAMSPASAAPLFTGGLVNVTIVDVLSGNTTIIQVPVAVAANLCDVSVNVLATQLKRTGQAACTAVADSTAN